MTTQITEFAELYSAMSYNKSRDTLSIANEWLIGKDPLKCYYDGAYHFGIDKTDSINDPCTDQYVVSVAVPSADDITNGLHSASCGQKAWNILDRHSRGKLISSIAKKLEELKDLIAEVEALTIGASLLNTKHEVTRAIAYFQYYASWAHTVEKKNGDTENGVLMLCLSKSASILALAGVVAPALATGHAVVINPTLQTSLTAFLFGELCSIASLPRGVVNVIPGCLKKFEAEFEKHVEKIVNWENPSNVWNVSSVLSFNFRKCLSIIFDSSDQTSAIDILLKNMSFSLQEMPWSVRTILVEESAYATFVSKFKKRLETFKIGNSRDHGIDIGLPKNCDEDTRKNLTDTINIFMQRGIEVYQIDVGDFLFFPLTLIIGSDAEKNHIWEDNSVYPFVSIVPFRNSKEALEFANKSQFGAAASVWTTCLSLAMHMAYNLKAGTVWINDHGLTDPAIPFSSKSFGYIGGKMGLIQFLSHKNERTSYNHDGNNELMQEKDQSNRSDVKKAVAAAQKAQQIWWKQGNNERASIMLSAADKFETVQENFSKFFLTEGQENKKELHNTVNNFYYWAGRCNSTVSIGNDCPIPNSVVQSHHEPIGVIGILLEDFSNIEACALAVLSAISFGNSVLVVPHKNPILAHEFCSFLVDSKVPPGLVNVITGIKPNLYSEIVLHKDVNVVWYFGKNKESTDALHKLVNKEAKFLWKVPTIANWDAIEFEYAASHSKAVWIPCENISC